MIEFLIAGGIVLLVIVVIIGLLMAMRRTVEVGYSDVVTRTSGVTVYSTDGNVTTSKKSDAVYYRIPEWVPRYGTMVRNIPLGIISIPVRDYKTFAQGNPRFVVDATIMCRVHNVLEAAQKVPNSGSRNFVKDFQDGFKEIIISAIRKTTANYTVPDVIAKRSEIGKTVGDEIGKDLEEWGFRLTNVAIVDIRDPPKETADGKVIVDKNGEQVLETTVVLDISRMKEADINAQSRREVANKKRDAEIAEAESFETSKTRQIQAEETVAKREQAKAENVAVEQKKAVEKELEVQRTNDVGKAQIGASARVAAAEGEKNALILSYEAQKQQKVLDGEGQAYAVKVQGLAEGEAIKAKLEGQAGEAEAIRQKGLADGDAIRARKLAEAEGLSKIADAQKKQQEYATRIRIIEMQETLGKAYAAALGQAKVKAILTGEPKSLLDLFTPGGGVNIGGMISSMKETDPEAFGSLLKSVGLTADDVKKFIGAGGKTDSTDE